ncbi:MAG: hypothetical protein CMD20_04990 [Flavobacteriales bacterium]|nr:hypothetical protein [Flavobacteriales bacterium]
MKKLFGLILIIFLSIYSHAQSGCLPQFTENSFQLELKKIKAHDFDQAKKEAIEILLNECITSLQLKKLLQELSFEEDKLELAKKGYKKVSDPDKFDIIKDVFDFEDSKIIIDTLSK